MKQVSSHSLIIFSGLNLGLSAIIFLINALWYHYSGNNYFPENVPLLISILIFLNLGLKLYFRENVQLMLIGQELFYFFLVMCVIAIATNAVQLTPFPIIDSYIVAFEKQLHIDLVALLDWAGAYPYLRRVLSLIYDSLPYQMSILPLFIIITGNFSRIREYYLLLLCSTLIGFGFYYFFPTIAPASILHSPLFSAAQIDTGLKFEQIHQHLMITTNKGGLIALPSFHTIWAILCVNLLKDWPILFFSLFFINCLLIISCVLLGWHYVTDIIGSVIVLAISYFFLKQCGKELIPIKPVYFTEANRFMKS